MNDESGQTVVFYATTMTIFAIVPVSRRRFT